MNYTLSEIESGSTEWSHRGICHTTRYRYRLCQEYTGARCGYGKAAKKTVTKRPAPKKREATAIDIVLAIVNRSKKGVDSATVMKKTGYNKKKVANCFASLKKQGKIKSGGKGVYVKA